MKSTFAGTIIVALSAVVAVTVHAQTADDLQKAEKCRAEAAYLEMRGDSAAAVARYEESLTYYQDETIVSKVEALKANLSSAGVPSSKDLAGWGGKRDGLLAGDVLARLDVDADLLFYLNAENLISPLRAELQKLTAAIRVASAKQPDAGEASAGKVSALVDPLLDWMGLYSIRALGVSLAPVEPGITRIKSYIRRNEGQSDRVIWKLYGEAKVLDTLKYLPSDTVTMEILSVRPAVLWSAIEEGLDLFAAPEMAAAMNHQLDELKTAQHIDIRALLPMLDDEVFAALTLSESVTVEIPLPGNEPMSIPEPGLLLGVKAKDTSMLDAVVSALKARQIPLIEKTVGLATMYTVNIPAKLPIAVQPSMMMHEGCLLLASSPALLERALQSYALGGELTGVDTFRQAFHDRPAAVSALAYAGSRFSKEYCHLQTVLAGLSMKGIAENSAMASLVDYYIRNIIQANDDNYCATYQVNDASGLLTVSYVKTPYGNPLVMGIMTPVAASALLGISALEQAQTAAARSTCMMNQQNIEMAKNMWAMDQGVSEGTPVWEDLAAYLPGGAAPVCPLCGEYTIGSLGEAVTCSLPEHNWPDIEEDNQYEGDDEAMPDESEYDGSEVTPESGGYDDADD